MIAPGENNKIMHGELRTHDAVIMFADAGKHRKEKSAGMYLYVDNVNRVYETAILNGAYGLTAPEKKDIVIRRGLKTLLEITGIL
jgi:PhnB protein